MAPAHPYATSVAVYPALFVEPLFSPPLLFPISSTQTDSAPLSPPSTLAPTATSKAKAKISTTPKLISIKTSSASKLSTANRAKMASPSLPAPFLTRPEFASMALDSVKESYGDKFDFELDDDNFCILFKNKLNPENIGKMYLQNRYQCMLSYGPDINTEKVISKQFR